MSESLLAEPTMPKRITGRYERTAVGGEEVAAFVPHPLPPARPRLVVDAGLAERLRAAEQALVRLELAGEMVPSLDWLAGGSRSGGESSGPVGTNPHTLLCDRSLS